MARWYGSAIHPTDVNRGVQRIINRLTGSVDPIEIPPEVDRGTRVQWYLAAAGTIRRVPAVAAFHLEQLRGAESVRG